MLPPPPTPARAELLAAALIVGAVALAGALLLGCGAPPIDDTKSSVSVQIETDTRSRYSRPGDGDPGTRPDVVLERTPARVVVRLEETTTAIPPAGGLELRPWARSGVTWTALPSIVLELGGSAELGDVAGDGALWFEVVRLEGQGRLELLLEAHAP